MSPNPYVGSVMCDEEKDEEMDNSINETERGKFYASNVILDRAHALGTLAWVLGRMERSLVKKVPAHQRDVLYVVKKEDGLGGYERVLHDQDYYKGRMPKSKNRTLFMLEELGHRHHGQVYCTMSRNGNLCVLKYFVNGQYAVKKNLKRRN